tara:strand:+ start:1530 stop:1712 length:183 start_codon:yes stop_codon:yes gene_type:complete
MWVLIWFKVVVGLGVEYYQLETYNTFKECQQQIEKAKVMKTTAQIKLACVEIRPRGEVDA